MKKWCWIVLVLFLSGCSSQFVYNNMDWMIHWYLDDYIDLNKPQKKVFDKHFTVWQVWHREEELAKYAAQIKEIIVMIESDSLTQEAMSNHFEQLRSHWVSLRNRIAPDLAEMAPALTVKQVGHLFEYLEEQNAEREEEQNEFAGKSEEERMEVRAKDIRENISEWIGKLTEPQKQLVKHYSPQFRSNGREWLKYRRLVQEHAHELFINKDSDPEFKTKLLAVMSDPESYRHQTLIENSEHNGKVYTAMVVELSQQLTSKQKKRLLRKLDGYIEDFEDLSED